MLIRLPLLTRHPSICAQIAPKFCFQLWALSMKREPRNEKTQYDHFTLMVQGLDFGLNRLIDGDLQNSLFDDRLQNFKMTHTAEIPVKVCLVGNVLLEEKS